MCFQIVVVCYRNNRSKNNYMIQNLRFKDSKIQDSKIQKFIITGLLRYSLCGKASSYSQL